MSCAKKAGAGCAGGASGRRLPAMAKRPTGTGGKAGGETTCVLVETVSQSRRRYFVDVPVGKVDWALDTVVMGEAPVASEVSLGETIVSHREVSREEAGRILSEGGVGEPETGTRRGRED